MNSAVPAKIARWLVLSAFLLLVTGLPARPAYACTPFPPTPWFATKSEVISANVPQGMSFLESEYGSLQLHNLTSAAIRIQVLKGWGGKDGLEPIMGYDEIPSGDSGYVSWSESLYLNNDIVSSFESQNVIADNRPANPKIPEPRIVPLHILLNDQPIDLQLRVTYRLNEQYINDSVYNFEHACQSPEEALFRELAPLGGFVCIWLSALLAGVYIYLRSRSNKVPQNKAGGHV